MIYFLVFWMVQGFLPPQQIHLSWTENQGELRITWINFINSQAAVEVASDTCDTNLNIEIEVDKFDFGTELKRVGYIYSAVLQGLEEKCIYSYRVLNGIFSSQEFSFSGWTPGDELEGEEKMVIFGDLGVSSFSLDVIKGIEKFTEENHVIGIVHLGDLAYDLFGNQGLVGDRFGEMIEPLSARLPYMTVPGNHESAANFSHYRHRYLMPRAVDEGLFYSFEAGLAKYILLNTNTFYYEYELEVETQLNWLKHELAEVDKEKYPWLIMLHHHPLYCSTELNNSKSEFDCTIKTEKVRSYLEQLYNTYKVDLVLQGHMHKYERDSVMYNNKEYASENDTDHQHFNPIAPVYIITGNGGNGIGVVDPLITTKPTWQKIQFLDYGFGVLSISNKTHLLWEHFNGAAMTLLDYVHIIRNS